MQKRIRKKTKPFVVSIETRYGPQRVNGMGGITWVVRIKSGEKWNKYKPSTLFLELQIRKLFKDL